MLTAARFSLRSSKSWVGSERLQPYLKGASHARNVQILKKINVFFA